MSTTARSRHSRVTDRGFRSSTLVVLVCFSGFLTGCASSHLHLARSQYYRGNFEQSADALSELSRDITGRALMLMERGMIQQARGAYKESTQDWLLAHELTEHLDYLSLSRSSASLLINDDMLAFRGAFYERVLLHAFAAKSYMAMNQWDGAAVESRNIINKLESRDEYPDDAYSRYLAGFFLEMQGDWEGASLQYRTASALLKTAHIDEHSGSITRATDGAPSPEPGLPSRMRGAPAQLVCFISIGSASPGYRSRAAGRAHEHPEYARLFADDIYLGRSHRLTNVPHLRRKTEKVLKKRQKAKRAARIAIKEAAAQLVSQEDEALGDILRLLLFSLETDDSRRWETLPRDLHVARVACPVEPSEFRIALYDVRGRKIAEQALTSPIVRIGNVYGSFLRVF